MDMFALFQCLKPQMTATTLRQFSRMALAMLVMTGRVTMLHSPLGGQRRQLPYRPALVLPGPSMGHAILGVFSSPRLPARGCLPVGWR